MRLIRSIMRLKKKLNKNILISIANSKLDKDSNIMKTLTSFNIDIDLDENIEKLKKIDISTYSAEFEIFIGLLVLLCFLKSSEIEKAVKLSDVLVEEAKKCQKIDTLTSKVYFYYYRAYELCGRSKEIRHELLAAYRTSCIHHNPMGQATLLNLLLRDYIKHNLYDLALKLVSKTNFPDNLRSNAQYARYLYYLGRIKAVQLEYSDAYSKLIQAVRKSPQGPNSALGFRLAATKLAIVVQLLTGEIPERQIFNTKEFRQKLLPYRNVVQAVRLGDLLFFKKVLDKYSNLFEKDNTIFLMNRLHHNVIKAGLRMINLSYSRLSLDDVGRKLGLDESADVVGVVVKAIGDGVIEASVDLSTRTLQSKANVDIYSTYDPCSAFDRRIVFCLQLYNDAVKAMTYPDEDQRQKDHDDDERRQRQQEIIALAEEGDDEDITML
eukprot:GHVL01037259.1.p1 GENE.GHVL01037259.1~~GHVL01037259.1.p1  ORF type:complete len:503 (+),score=101.70 GHVL01037259.1:199-1509(+)